MSFFSKDLESLTSSKIDPEKEYSPNFTLDLALEIPLPLSRKTTSGDIQTSSQSHPQGQKLQDISRRSDAKLRPGFQVPGYHGSSQNASQPEMALNFDTMRQPAFPPPAATLTQPRVPFSQPTFNHVSQPTFSQHPVRITRPQASYFQPRPGRFIRPVGIHRPQASYLQHQGTFIRPPASHFQSAATLHRPQVPFGQMASHSQSSFFTRPSASNSQPTAKYERPAWVSKEIEKPKPRG